MYELQPIIVCSNNDPGLTLTYFSARSYFCNLGFYIEKCESDHMVMDSLDIIAACDLEIAWYP